MSDQVFKYQCQEDYIEGLKFGEPVSEKLGDPNEAYALCNRFQSEDPEHYYNLRHFTACQLITKSRSSPKLSA